MTKIVTLGEILVEIVAEDRGEGFRQPVRLVGPFPSGAPAIFIDQVAKLGQPCGIVSCVGDDDFGWVNLRRLGDDGVDVRAVEISPAFPTGSAFVRYRDNGERDFVYNIKNSACGQVRWTEAVSQLLEECGHLHVSGPSLFSAEIIEMTTRAIEVVKGTGGTVSFDPNIRKEVVRDPEVRSALTAMLASCDTFLPSGDELTLLTTAGTPEGAISEILGLGVTAIVVKNGAEGATYYDADRRRGSAGLPGRGGRPTGAGDCFDATFVTCRLQGRSVAESLAYANASGARAVAIKGPMEGTSTFAELDVVRSAGGAGTKRRLTSLISRGAGGGHGPAGVTSVCSAHPTVVEAAMHQAAAEGTVVLIEATCNQVNHQGGYTGLTPAAFRDQVYGIADQVGFPRRQVVLGGDHLGPNPWRHLPAEVALSEAEAMVAAYVVRRLPEDPPRHEHGLPGRARAPSRRGDGRAGRPPGGGGTSRRWGGRPVPALRHRHRGTGAGRVGGGDRAPRGDPARGRRRHPRSTPQGLCRRRCRRRLRCGDSRRGTARGGVR